MQDGNWKNKYIKGADGRQWNAERASQPKYWRQRQ